jgi:hypothetical protein
LQVLTLALCGGMLWAAAPAPDSRALGAVYLEGEVVRLVLSDEPKPVTVGPWRLGPRVSDNKPRDKRLNLYLVAPGTQYHLEGSEDYDHNAIINALPAEGKSREYDVYWALVLDPRLKTDLRTERDLIVAAQTSFTPGDLFEFADIPTDFLLQTYLKVDSLEELEKFRRRDRTLPRVIIIPAGFAITASAPPAPTGAAAP